MGNDCSFFCAGLLMALFAVSSCGGKTNNSVGSTLLDQQHVGRLDSVTVSDATAFTVFLGRDTISSGGDSNLLVGSLNGFVFKSLIRFEVPIDSLVGTVDGGQVTDFTVEDLSVELNLLNSLPLDGVNLTVKLPVFSWDEETAYHEAQAGSEENPSQAIDGAVAVVLQPGQVRISLPGTFLTDRIDSTTTVIQLNLVLESDGESQFLLDLAARTNEGPSIRVQYVVQVDRFGFPGSYQALASEDNYWAEVTGTGPDPEVPMISNGIVFTPLITFEIPEIPLNSTVHFAQIDFEIDQERSFFESVSVLIDQVLFSSTSTNPIFTFPPGNSLPSSQKIEGLSGSLNLNQILVQGWISNVFTTREIRLRPVSGGDGVSWIVFKNIRLKFVYTNPIEI